MPDYEYRIRPYKYGMYQVTKYWPPGKSPYMRHTGSCEIGVGIYKTVIEAEEDIKHMEGPTIFYKTQEKE